MTIILVYVDDSDVAIMQTHFTKKIENYWIAIIIISLRSDDVIVTSPETTLSRTASQKDITIFSLITSEN